MSHTLTGLSCHRKSKYLSSSQGLWSIHFCTFLYPDPLSRPFQSCNLFQCGYWTQSLNSIMSFNFKLFSGNIFAFLLQDLALPDANSGPAVLSKNGCFCFHTPHFQGCGSENRIIDILLLSPHCFSFKNPSSFEVFIRLLSFAIHPVVLLYAWTILAMETLNFFSPLLSMSKFVTSTSTYTIGSQMWLHIWII